MIALWPERVWPWGKRKAPERVRERREPVEQMLRRLDFTVLRPIALRLGGDLRSVARGSGLDPAEIREYQPGDDVRHPDWRATARTGGPDVRQTYAERGSE